VNGTVSVFFAERVVTSVLPLVSTYMSSASSCHFGSCAGATAFIPRRNETAATKRQTDFIFLSFSVVFLHDTQRRPAPREFISGETESSPENSRICLFFPF